jgi:plasmid stabilization system protein ParE
MIRSPRAQVVIVLAAGDLLAEQPNIGRPGRIPGTRELVAPKTSYIIPYRVRGDTLQSCASFTSRDAYRRGGSSVLIRKNRHNPAVWRIFVQ